MSRPGLPFRSHLFTLSDIELHGYPADSGKEILLSREYILLGIVQGEGTAVMDGKRYRLVKGGCFLLQPHQLCEIVPAAEGGLMLYRIGFCMQRIAAGGESTGAEPEAVLFPLAGKLNIQPFGQWSAMLEEMYRHRSQEEELEQFRQHIRLQELLYYIFQRNLQENTDPRASVSRTIDALHEDVTQNFSIIDLAEKANMSTRQYSYLFKELTGQTPLDYITALRINEAKKQLLITNDHMNVVARNSGFQDVYYFSRRFKQLVGLSPKQFVSKRRSELRVVAMYYGGILSAIGVKPVGANLSWWGGSAFLQDIESGIPNIGPYPTLEQIAKLEPDLILMNDINREDYKAYSKIAPTLLIPYDGKRSVYGDTRLIGALVNNPRAADHFIARYEKKAVYARAKITATGIDTGHTEAAIIRIEGGGTQFALFGDNYGRSGWAVYRGLCLQAPPKVQELIDSGKQVKLGIPIHHLPDYVGSCHYLFVINEGEGVELIADHEIWNALPAVRQHRMLELGREEFSYFDPLSLEGQLERLTELLLVKESEIWSRKIYN